MKKLILVFVIGGFLGTGVGFTVGIFFYPFIFLADVVATEQVENRAEKTVVADGVFVHADPSDPVHYGRGSVTLFSDTVHLGADFEVGPGPKYKVYLVSAADINSTSDVKKAKFSDLGSLKAFKGSQNFAVPANLNLSEYKSVVIWCEAFGVLISPAKLAYR